MISWRPEPPGLSPAASVTVTSALCQPAAFGFCESAAARAVGRVEAVVGLPLVGDAVAVRVGRRGAGVEHGESVHLRLRVDVAARLAAHLARDALVHGA